MTRQRLVTAGVVLVTAALVAGLAIVGVRWWSAAQRSDLERAVAVMPRAVERLSWTAWAQVRAELDADVDVDPTAAELRDLLSEGFDADLTSNSVLGSSAEALRTALGFSPATVRWEMFGQAAEGALLAVDLGEGTDVDDVRADLADAGYTEDDGIWTGDDGQVAGLGLSPELTAVSVDDDGLLLASDEPAYLEGALDAPMGGDLDDVEQGLADVVDALGEPVSASLATGARACADLAMSQADTADQQRARELVDAAGGVDPLTGFAIAREGEEVVVALAFENDEQARENADSRSVLASGEAPGQGGEFAERFDVERSSAEGRVVRLDLTPVEGAYVLSDLSSGPVLFATC